LDSVGEPTETIQEFLARPVKIVSYSWTDGGGGLPNAPASAFDPLRLWLGNPAVDRKLAGYASFNIKLRMIVTLTGSPFQYGKLYVSVKPGSDAIDGDGNQYVNYGGVAYYNSTADFFRVAMSQRYGGSLYAADSTSLEIDIPLILTTDRIERATLEHFADVYAKYVSVNMWSPTGLHSASGTTTPVQINVYAMATEVELADRNAEFQSSDITDTISQLKVEMVDTAMSGQYDNVTSAGLLALGSAATLAGFSNPSVQRDAGFSKPDGFPNFSSVSSSGPSNSLGMANHSYITGGAIPRRFEDELNIANLGKIPSYLGTVALPTGIAANTVVLNARVTPLNYCKHVSTLGSGNKQVAVNYTPAGYIANYFNYWRGDVVYEFEYVGSKMHRGQLRVTYDPHSAYTATFPTSGEGMVRNCIWDISENTKLQVKIPYNSITPWKRVKTDAADEQTDVATNPITTLAATQIKFDIQSQMGNITIATHTRIVGVEDDNPDTYLIVHTWVENLELAVPNGVQNGKWLVQNEPAYYQSGEVDPCTLATYMPGRRLDVRDEEYFGERIESLRALLHRPVPGPILTTANSVTNTMTQESVVLPIHPLPVRFFIDGGPYLNYGYMSVVTPPSATVQKIDYHILSPMVYFGACFALRRGGVRWRFKPAADGTGYQESQVHGIRVSRPVFTNVSDPVVGRAGQDSLTTTELNTITKTQKTLIDNQMNYSGGMATSTAPTQCVDVVFPFYSRFKAEPAGTDLAEVSYVHDLTQGVLTSMFDSRERLMRVSWESTYGANTGILKASIATYVSADSDYDLFWFISAPTVWYLQTTPTAQ